MIRNGTDISEIRDTLVFGPSVGGGEAPGAESLPDTAEIAAATA
jgi:NAD(P)H-nitrite reductase large subunit